MANNNSLSTGLILLSPTVCHGIKGVVLWRLLNDLVCVEGLEMIY